MELAILLLPFCLLSLSVPADPHKQVQHLTLAISTTDYTSCATIADSPSSPLPLSLLYLLSESLNSSVFLSAGTSTVGALGNDFSTDTGATVREEGGEREEKEGDNDTLPATHTCKVFLYNVLCIHSN